MCLIGPGGTGKSYLINKMYKWAIKHEKTIGVTALTGCAAYLLNETSAKTIHSWSGIYRYDGRPVNPVLIQSYVKLIHKKRKQAMTRWLTTDILIIDEISMMDTNYLTLLDGIARNLRSIGFNDESLMKKPFGGIQMVFVGDFLQIPPVLKKGSTRDEIIPIFESRCWRSMINKRSLVVVLKKNFRAIHDAKWTQMLIEIRQGKCSDAVQKALESRLLTLKKIKNELDHSIIKPTVLVSTKLEVDAINIANLEKCDFTTERSWDMKPVRWDMETNISSEVEVSELSARESIALKEAMDNSIVPNKLVLRQGAQVMCTANIDLSCGLVNGARGVVKGFDKETGNPIVYWKSIGNTTIVKPYEFQTNHVMIKMKQYPLCQAWAITIHKSQGQTLDSVEVDIGDSVFDAGQAYVALSRVRSIQSLYIRNFSKRSIFANPYALRFAKAVNDI